MSDSRCRMLMVISELRRQMKMQLKDKGEAGIKSQFSLLILIPTAGTNKSPSLCGREIHAETAAQKLNPITSLVTKGLNLPVKDSL